MTTALAAVVLLLLPVFWVPNHTCKSQPAGRAFCLGCRLVVLTTFVLALALPAALFGTAHFRAPLQPAGILFRSLPPAFGRSPPSTRS